MTDHPRDAELSVLAANAFPEERRCYFEEMAEQAETLRSFLAAEDEADRAQRRAEGDHWSSVVGAATGTRTSGRLWEVLLYSRDREHRDRAAAAICRRLRRGRTTEAA